MPTSREPAVPLHVHSVYSLGRGTATPAALAEQAARYGHDALALTDRNALYGAIPFVEACRDWGVRPILGAEVDGPEGIAVLLVRDAVGYAHLCRLLSLRHLDPGFSLVETLAAWGDGLHVLVDDPALLGRLAPRLARGTVWGELRAAGTTGTRHAAVRAAAAAAGAGVVATGPVAGITHADHALHVTLSAVRENSLVARLAAAELAHPDAVFKAPAALRSRFREHPDALANTRRIADDCRFVPSRERWILPSLCLEPGTDALEHLRALCHAGMDRRYGHRPRRARLRLERELGVIARLGFVDYFVIVGDIVGFARARGIATVGRGSGAGALTAYLLGITNVDPLRYGLSFERFLHEKRPDCPDLDIDLCWKRRDEVIDHVYRTYGRDRTAMISTHTTYRVRSAFREAAKAHGVPARAVDRLGKLLPGRAESVAEALRGSPRAAREIPRDIEPWPTVLRHAERMLGFPRHLGVHPGGIVIADRPIDHYVPLEEATKGIVVTQYEMRAIETVGLVKIDLLGNRALSTIQETLELVEARTGERLEPDAFPDPDPATAALFTAGDTLGVFQMESPGMRNLNRMLRTDDLATTIAAVALIRPGPAGSGMKERFVRRRRGLEPAVPLHPRLAGVLAETHGIPLYEEDVMRMAAAAGGVTLEDGDMIRRAIVEARPEQREEIGRVFRRACERRGLSAGEAREVWEQLLRFGAFAFCKAHAAGYGVLAYQAGWLKAHHPVEFTAALLNHHAGMYETRTHAEDARRRGVRLLLPHVNRSREESVPEGSAVRLGLGMLRGVGDACRARILDARGHGPFRGVEDLLLRAAPARPEAEALVLAGALDGLGRSRPEAVCVLDAHFDAYAARRRRDRGEDLFGFLPPELAPVPALPEFGAAERLWLEWHLLGVCVGDHPMRLFRAGGAVGDALPAAEAERSGGRRVRVAGVVAARRTVPTRRDELMQFVTLEDETGMVECTLFPEVYRRHRGAVRTLGPYVAEGRVEDQYGAPTLTVERIHAVPVPEALAAAERRLRAAAS